MKNPLIITIGREYGSGGREIGQALAKRLGIAYYDKEIITLAAKKSGLGSYIPHLNSPKDTKLSCEIVSQVVDGFERLIPLYFSEEEKV